ncbi:MFS transporter [Chloroflexota bacterium]
MPRRKKIFYGWWIVLAASILHFFAGGTFFYGFTVFFNPIRQTFGWTAAVTSVAFALQRLEYGALGPVAGLLVDRVGPRKLMLCGWSAVGLGFLLMSQVSSLWAFYGTFLIIAAGLSFGQFVVTTTAIAHWFAKKRSRAMTLIYVGMGASGLLAPLLALSISQFGWRMSLVMIGITLWAIGIPLSSVMRHKPGQYGYLPDGEDRAVIYETANVLSLRSSSDSEIVEQDSGPSATGFTTRAALKTRAFWLLSLVFFFQHIGTSAVSVHIVPYLESVKIPTAVAATAVTSMTLLSLIGRVGFGWLGDFVSKRYLIAIALTLQTIGLFIFSWIDVDRTWLIVLSLLIYAPGYGGTIPLRPGLQADYFGTRSFGTIMGLMSCLGMVAGMTSPILAGWVFDVMGSYNLAWRVFAFATIPAVPLMLLVKPPEVTQELELHVKAKL